MARRRAEKRPGLLARVRWANLGRSAALLAAGLIVVTRGCGAAGPDTARIPAGLPPAVAAPPVTDPGSGPDPGSREDRAVRRRKRRRRRGGGHRRVRASAEVPRSSTRIRSAQPSSPVVRWAPPALPEWFP